MLLLQTLGFRARGGRAEGPLLRDAKMIGLAVRRAVAVAHARARKDGADARSGAEGARDLEISAMLLHRCFRQRQTKPGAEILSSMGVVDLAEGLQRDLD